MKKIYPGALACIVMLGAMVVTGDVLAQSTVSYGRITAVRQVELRNQGAQAAGTMVGGLAGLASGSGRSSSNRALRTLGGAAVGGQIAGAASNSTGFEYTVLVPGGNTVTIVTEKGGLRVRDCVSVERGQFNNIRLAPDARCDAALSPASQAAATSTANACASATQQVLNATTDEEFERAERRMRLLCD